MSWRASITHGTLDLSSAYRKVFLDELPHMTLVADRSTWSSSLRRSSTRFAAGIRCETLGHRGRQGRSPLSQSTDAHHGRGATERGRQNQAAQPVRGGRSEGRGRSRLGQAKEAVQELYSHQDQPLALRWLDELSADLADGIRPPEVRSLGRTLKRWRSEITAWHASHFTNGPTETMNNLIKRVAFGFTSLRNYRIRALLFAGKPDWSLLATIKPC